MDNELAKAVERLEDFIESRHAKLSDSLDGLHGRIGVLEVTSAGQAADLKHHIYRTELAEKGITLLSEKIEKTKEDLKPLTAHVIEHNTTKTMTMAWIGIAIAILTAAATYLAGK